MRGVLYTATGPMYVEQALVAIRSLRRWNDDLGVAIFTDEPAAFDGVADHVVSIESRQLPREQRMLPRLQCLKETPFERTLAMDTDTIVMGPINEVFDVLDRVGVGICHGHQRARRFAAALRDGKALSEIPYAFAPVQGGVVLYDDGVGRQFVDDVVDLYQEKQYIDDQVSMREVLWKADYRYAFLGPEYNVWQLDTLEQWALGNFEQAWPKVFHTVILKDRLNPDQIDRLLLPIAERAVAAQRRSGEAADGGAPTEPGTRLALRSRVGGWRAQQRLMVKLKRAERM